MSISAQHVIKVKKGQTIKGAFYFQGEDKTKDYLLFSEEGYVYILEKSKFKPKKAVKLLKAEEQDFLNPSNKSRIQEYTFQKNIINFSSSSTEYVKDYNGTFEDGGSKIVFKVSETNQLMEVREYERIE